MVDDQTDGLKQHGILGIGVLYLLGLGRLLGLVQYGLQALAQPPPDCRVLCWAKAERPSSPEASQLTGGVWGHCGGASLTWGRVALQEAQKLHRQPWCRDKIVGVILQVCGSRRHDLRDESRDTLELQRASHQHRDAQRIRLRTYPAEPCNCQRHRGLELLRVLLGERGDEAGGCSHNSLEAKGGGESSPDRSGCETFTRNHSNIKGAQIHPLAFGDPPRSCEIL